MGSFQLSLGQESAAMLVDEFLRDQGRQLFVLFGYAGTGKTTLARELVAQSSGRWLFAAYTGRAASVMRQKGCRGAQTIHSLIYRPDDTRGRRGSPVKFRLWDESPLRDAAGIVIDECSMVDEEIGRDLMSFGKKVLVLGDPDQLPPVSGGGFFTDRTPDAFLTEIHRQARDSAILDLATHVRLGRPIHDWRPSSPSDDCVIVQRDPNKSLMLWKMMIEADQVIVGTNRTRQSFNAKHRKIFGKESPHPEAGDKIVCLRNDRESGLLNGSLWRIEQASVNLREKSVGMQIVDEAGSRREVRSWVHHFIGNEAKIPSASRRSLQEFDFGYNVTCHKAQGGQWGSVVLFDESNVFDLDSARRWLYTGITRAARKLVVVV